MRKQRELPGERDNARNNARCMQARNTTDGVDRQHQYVDTTPGERVNQNDGKRKKKVNDDLYSTLPKHF